MHLPSYRDVEAAADRIAPLAVRTPLLQSSVLDARVGGRVLLKAETLQRIGAFKFRGAYNAVSHVDQRRFPGGVVACSSGNHAQGVAEAARLCGLRAAIVMPADAPRIKVEGTRALGAEVVRYDRDTEDRQAIADRLADERGAALVLPFDDPLIIAGQGTAGLELMQQAEAIGAPPDLVLVPCSGGGLVTGIALAVKHARPDAEVYAVEPAGFDDFGRSLAAGSRQRNSRTSGSICDALLSTEPGVLTFALARERLAGGLAVSDAEVRAAMRYAFGVLKLVVEPGGAVALAALLSGKIEARGRTVAVVLSGGNVDPELYASAIVSAEPS